MTSEQLKIVNDAKSGLDHQIKKYINWDSPRFLNVIYFEAEESVFLLAVVPDGISNDDAGMFVAMHYFRIEKDGKFYEITFDSYHEKRNLAKEVIRVNPNA
jgi:hypothetical protein